MLIYFTLKIIYEKIYIYIIIFIISIVMCIYIKFFKIKLNFLNYLINKYIINE